jgi:hypothetical protein
MRRLITFVAVHSFFLIGACNGCGGGDFDSTNRKMRCIEEGSEGVVRTEWLNNLICVGDTVEYWGVKYVVIK